MKKNNLTNLLNLLNKKEFIQAEKKTKELISLSPKDKNYRNILAIIYANTGKSELALEILQKIILDDKEFQDAYNNLFTILDSKYTFKNSETIYLNLLKSQPDNLKILIKYSNNLLKIENYNQSIKILEKIIKLDNKNIRAIYNLGCAYNGLVKIEKANLCFKKVIKIDANHFKSQYNLALNHLTTLNFKKGWEGFEYRKKVLEIKEEILGIPKTKLWDGKSFTEVLVVHAEQGIGDEILISSLFQEVSKYTNKLIISCDKRLTQIFEESFPYAQFIDRNKTFEVDKNAKHIFGFSLCKYFRSEIDSFKFKQYKWLKPKFTNEHNILDNMNNLKKIKIGISWKSTGNYNEKRNISLSDYFNIFPEEYFELINLQYGNIDSDIKNLKKLSKRNLIHFNNFDYKNDIHGLSRLILSCDLIVSIGGFTSGLAGALGKETWALIPNTVEWVWVKEPKTQNSLWFTQVRVFKQKTIGDWKNVFDSITKEVMYKFDKIQ